MSGKICYYKFITLSGLSFSKEIEKYKSVDIFLGMLRWPAWRMPCNTGCSYIAKSGKPRLNYSNSICLLASFMAQIYGSTRLINFF
jgi:hypothetical protein